MFGAEIDHVFTVQTHGNIESICFIWLKKSQIIVSLQSRNNFGEQVLSNLLTKILAAIFDCNGSGRLDRERNLY